MIYQVVSKYHTLSISDPYHRFKSWEHCFNFFRENYRTIENEKVFDQGCLHLAFYLASWGMLRGGSFLLQKDYRVHQYFLKEVVSNSRYEKYLENYTTPNRENVMGIVDLIKSTSNAYECNIVQINGKEKKIELSDTLISKILLGVYGIVPAYDRYFKQGLNMHGINQQLNQSSLLELAEFYSTYEDDFAKCQLLFSKDGIHYTPMKLVDMYFWQIGHLLDTRKQDDDEVIRIKEFVTAYVNARTKTKSYPSTTKKTVVNLGITNMIREYIIEKLDMAKLDGLSTIDIKSGDIHKELKLQNRMPPVCNAMVSLGVYNRYEVIHDTPSGASSTKILRYILTNNE